MASSRGEQVQRAELLADLGRYDEAADELRAVLDTDPVDVAALALLGYLRLRAERYDEALQSAEAATGIDPHNSLARDVRDQALLALGRASEVPPESPAWRVDEKRPGPDDHSAPPPAPPAWPPSRPGAERPWAERPGAETPEERERLEHGFTRMALIGATCCWIAPLLVAVFGRSQLFAGVLGIAGLAAVVLGAGRLPGPAGDGLGVLNRVDPWLARAGLLVAVSPVLLLAYAVTGYPWALGAMIAAGAAVLIIIFVVRADHGPPAR